MGKVIQFTSKETALRAHELENKIILKNSLVDYLRKNNCYWENKDGIRCGPEALVNAIIDSLLSEGWLNLT